MNKYLLVQVIIIFLFVEIIINNMKIIKMHNNLINNNDYMFNLQFKDSSLIY